MTRNIHSLGHAGGTRAPSTWAGRCGRRRFLAPQTPKPVPHRAPRSEGRGSDSAESRGSLGAQAVRGTEGHDSPQETVRVHGRPS